MPFREEGHLKVFKTFNNYIENVFLFAGTVFLVIFTVVVFGQIIFRNLLHIPMLWSIEVSLLCFFWSVFLGAAVGLRRRRHYVVELLPEHYIKFNLITSILAHLFVLYLLYIFTVYGYAYAERTFYKMSTSISMPQGYFYICLPISSVAMVFFTFELLVEDCQQLIGILRGEN